MADEKVEVVDYSLMSKDELKAVLDSKGIKHTSRDTKITLLEKLK